MLDSENRLLTTGICRTRVAHLYKSPLLHLHSRHPARLNRNSLALPTWKSLDPLDSILSAHMEGSPRTCQDRSIVVLLDRRTHTMYRPVLSGGPDTLLLVEDIWAVETSQYLNAFFGQC